MGEADLFGDEGGEGKRGREIGKGAPRLVRVNRKQLELQPVDLESMLPPDHRARLIWGVVESLDLGVFHVAIRAREGESGRSATDPKVLLGLWVLATTEGVGSARELKRRCDRDVAYRWMRGGVSVNYHTLSDFRSLRSKEFSAVVTQVIAAIASASEVDTEQVLQDGTRVRASAGVKSFRRKERLRVHLAAAEEQLKAAAESARAPHKESRRAAAEKRAAREREERVRRALETISELEEMRSQQTGGKRSKGEPRGSTTDPDARLMRMPDKGFRPAYNVQVATSRDGNVIVGVRVSQGTDNGEVEPMLKEIAERTGNRPKSAIVDGGYYSHSTIEGAAEKGTSIYSPVPADKRLEDPYAPRAGDSEAVAQWRRRMATEEGKAIYAQRSKVERPNGDLKHWRSLDSLTVRGVKKVLSVALLNALAFNVMRLIAL